MYDNVFCTFHCDHTRHPKDVFLAQLTITRVIFPRMWVGDIDIVQAVVRTCAQGRELVARLFFNEASLNDEQV